MLRLFFDVIKPRSTLERLVLKNAAQRTSQRVKWTSGARVVKFFFSDGRTVGRTHGRTDGRSDGWSHGRTELGVF